MRARRRATRARPEPRGVARGGSSARATLGGDGKISGRREKGVDFSRAVRDSHCAARERTTRRRGTPRVLPLAASKTTALASRSRRSASSWARALGAALVFQVVGRAALLRALLLRSPSPPPMTSPSRFSAVATSPSKANGSGGGLAVGSPPRAAGCSRPRPAPAPAPAPPGVALLPGPDRDSYFAQMLERNCSVGKARRGSSATALDQRVERCGGGKEPFLGVAGGTASGKTTVCDLIMHNLQEKRVVLIAQDSYYRGLTPEEHADVATYNFDHPDAIDARSLVADLQSLLLRDRVEVPVYDFVTHSRVEETISVEPADVIIIEGILVLAMKEVGTCAT